MNRLAAVLIIAAALASGASTCQKPTPTGPVAPVVAGVIDCAEAGVHNVAVNIIDDAASALATGDWQAALVNMVKQFGEGAVDCAVREVGDTSGKHGSLDPLEATKAKRAQEWLDSRGVTFSANTTSKKGGGGIATTAGRVGVSPNEGPGAMLARPVVPGADDPGALLGDLTFSSPLSRDTSDGVYPVAPIGMGWSLSLKLPGGGEFVMVRVTDAGQYSIGI